MGKKTVVGLAIVLLAISGVIYTVHVTKSNGRSMTEEPFSTHDCCISSMTRW